MRNPISVTVHGGAAYVLYSDGVIAQTKEITETGSVAADIDAQGNVVGIEILFIVETEIAIAARFAHERQLGFPRDLMGVITPA